VACARGQRARVRRLIHLLLSVLAQGWARGARSELARNVSRVTSGESRKEWKAVANCPPHDPEQELSHLRRLRDAVLDVLKDLRLTADQKLEAIELLFAEELDEEEAEEDARDRERLS